MKNLLLLLLLSTAFFISCSEDEDSNLTLSSEKITGTLVLDETPYEIQDGLYSIEEVDSGIVVSTFLLVDGQINANDSTFSGSFQVAVLTFSKGTEFLSSTYPIQGNITNIAPTEDPFAIVFVTALAGEEEPQGSIGSMGSVNIVRSGDSFSFTFDTDILPEGKLTGSAVGALQLVELFEE